MIQQNIGRWSTRLEVPIAQYGQSNFGIIYRIYCSKTGVSYIGQTCDIRVSQGGSVKLTRIMAHYRDLKRGCHSTKALQASWDKYRQYFKDELLEFVPIYPEVSPGKQSLLKREKYWQQFFQLEETPASSDPLNKRHCQLEVEELKHLRNLGFINNQGLVYFISKLENTLCDSFVRLDPLTIAAEREILESSVDEAIIKLRASASSDILKKRHCPLEVEELKHLRNLGFINNQGLVYFIIKLENPWCDSPVRLDPLTIAAEWEIPEISVYEAIIKLRASGMLKIENFGIWVEWGWSHSKGSENPTPDPFPDKSPPRPRRDSPFDRRKSNSRSLSR